MFRRLLFLLSVLVFARAVQAADTTRVLYIGNSFIFTFDVPGIVKGLANTAGLPLVYSAHTPGGISVGDTAQGNQAHMNHPAVFNLIRQGGWDFVVLQDNQGRFVRDYGSFPASSKVLEGHIKILDSVRRYNPCARMIWFAGWAFKNGSPPFGNNGVEMIDRIWANYRFLNDSTHELISPIGPAWKRAIDELPGVDPWGPDEAHQSYAGSFLTAATLFTTMFRVHTAQLNFKGQLDSITASVYRTIAWQTVMDSMEVTNLLTYMPRLTVVANEFISDTGYVQYHWYRDGSLLGSTFGNTFPVAGVGCYYVVAENAEGCLLRSPEHCVQTTGIAEHRVQDLVLYPNPVENGMVVLLGEREERTLEVVNSMGLVVRQVTVWDERAELELDELPAGVYRLRVQAKGSCAAAVFMKL